jgi:hypothetical protein
MASLSLSASFSSYSAIRHEDVNITDLHLSPNVVVGTAPTSVGLAELLEVQCELRGKSVPPVYDALPES